MYGVMEGKALRTLKLKQFSAVRGSHEHPGISNVVAHNPEDGAQGSIVRVCSLVCSGRGRIIGFGEL